MDNLIHVRACLLEQIGVPSDLARELAAETASWGHFRFSKCLVALEQRFALEFSDLQSMQALRAEMALEVQHGR